MIVEQHNKFTVKDYNEFWDMYKDDAIGLYGNGTIPDDLIKLEAGEDGTDEELICDILSLDTDNFYHVQFFDDSEDGYFEIFTVGLGIIKHLNTPIRTYEFLLGEDGTWQTGVDAIGNEIQDTSTYGDVELIGKDVPNFHKRANDGQ